MSRKSFLRVLLGGSCLLLFIGCKTVKEIEYITVTDTVVEHDTTEVVIHDTTQIVQIKYDSIDRLIEKITYVDTNGVVHEKEIQKLTRYININAEKYKVQETSYKREISRLEKQLEAAKEKQIEYIEKPLYWWQKALIAIGSLTLVVAVGAIVIKIMKR